MRKKLSFFAALLLVAILTLSVTGCPDRAMAPKEETKPAAETPSAPATAPAPVEPAAK